MLKDLLKTRLEKWKRLEYLTSRASKYHLTGLSGEEVREFGQLYRRTAADLAIAREEVRDQRLVNYLNHLVARAHGAIYRSESSGFGIIKDFLRYEFPVIFRQTFFYTLASFLIFLVTAAFGFGISFLDERFTEKTYPDMRRQIIAHENWTARINQGGQNPVASTGIQTNNIQVTFLAFVGGILAGLGTIWIEASNGLMFGAVMGLCLKYKFADVPIFVSAHGVIELTAIFISGGAGLLIGKAMLMPGDLKRKDALVTNGLLAIKLILGCIPMLVVAGIIEGFLSPANISPYYKFAVSILSAIFLVVYFLKPDLRQSSTAGAK
ncbi:MAG: stage II sporulation protein M [Acidobacteria bacterium]|nr:stage II sporulation protein M [Acidobacteriota bacterium]